MKKVYIALAAIALMSSCNNKEQGCDPIEARFTAAEIGTRTIGDKWENGDLVGISMYSSDDLESPLADNIEYTSDAEGNFTEKNETIYYPTNGKVNFYAYYPFQETMSGGVFEANIANQSDMGAIDFMSAKIEGVSKSTTEQKFIFDHRMAMIKLNISLKLSILDLTGAKVEIRGANTTASFNTQTGAIISGTSGTTGSISLNTVEGEHSSNGYVESMTATAILLPETMVDGAEIVITLEGDQELKCSIAGEKFTAGMITSYDVSLGYNEITFAGSTVSPWIDAQDDETIYPNEEI